MRSPAAAAAAALRGPTCSISDINECRRYPGRLCGHKCENTPGSYYCSCTVGFRLSADGRSCEGERAPGGLLWPPSRGAPPLHPQTLQWGRLESRISQAHIMGGVRGGPLGKMTWQR